MSPHEVLGIPEDSSVSEVKSAFRKRCMVLHPDANKSATATQRFIEAKAAYDRALQRALERESLRGTSRDASRNKSKPTSGNSQTSPSGNRDKGGAASIPKASALGSQNGSQQQAVYVSTEILEFIDRVAPRYRNATISVRIMGTDATGSVRANRAAHCQPDFSREHHSY